MKTIAVAVTALAVALGGAALAQTPINFKDKKAVDKWMGDNKIDQEKSDGPRAAWNMLAVNENGIYFGRRIIEGSMQKDVTTFVLRLELFEPIVDGGRTIKSIAFDHEIDCRKKATRQVVLTSYANHNLNGSPVIDKTEEPFQPFAANPILATVAKEVCQFADNNPQGGFGRGQLGGALGSMRVPIGK